VHERRTEGRDQSGQGNESDGHTFERRTPSTGVANGQHDGEGLDHFHGAGQKHRSHEYHDSR
jgi:hypothetical protein